MQSMLVWVKRMRFRYLTLNKKYLLAHYECILNLAIAIAVIRVIGQIFSFLMSLISNISLIYESIYKVKSAAFRNAII